MNEPFNLLKRLIIRFKRFKATVPFQAAIKFAEMLQKTGGTLLTAGTIGLALTNDTVTAPEALYVLAIGVTVAWHGFMLEINLRKREEK